MDAFTSSSSKIPIRYAKVPYGTVVGSVLGDTVDLWQDPRNLWQDPRSREYSPGLLAMVDPSPRRVLFVTEFGEGLGSLPPEVKRLLDSKQAYCLAVSFPAFRGSLRERVTESLHAYWWVFNWPEDRRLMRHLITESEHACMWAARWPEERHLMRGRVTDPEDVAAWNEEFPDDQINLFG